MGSAKDRLLVTLLLCRDDLDEMPTDAMAFLHQLATTPQVDDLLAIVQLKLASSNTGDPNRDFHGAKAVPSGRWRESELPFESSSIFLINTETEWHSIRQTLVRRYFKNSNLCPWYADFDHTRRAHAAKYTSLLDRKLTNMLVEQTKQLKQEVYTPRETTPRRAYAQPTKSTPLKLDGPKVADVKTIEDDWSFVEDASCGDDLREWVDLHAVDSSGDTPCRQESQQFEQPSPVDPSDTAPCPHTTLDESIVKRLNVVVAALKILSEARLCTRGVQRLIKKFDNEVAAEIQNQIEQLNALIVTT